MRVKSSRELKGLSCNISAARAGPMCMIESNFSAEAELTSTCPWLHPVEAEGGNGVGVAVGTTVGMGVGTDVGGGMGLTAGTGVAVGVGVGAGVEVGTGMAVGRGVAVGAIGSGSGMG